MTRKKRRLMLVGLGMLLLGSATALTLTAFQDNLVFFYSPSDVQEKHVDPGRRFRLGGLVEEGSVHKDGTTVRFNVTDLNNSLPVSFTGILPDLFREGQGVVAEGALDGSGTFKAVEVLAKHDENYMPPEVAESLKKSGKWTGAETERMKEQGHPAGMTAPASAK
ncbi:cytochrome c maturation protein CcmE [Insolitispirillum peregrinum]|uniref:Cytochrome c-type biogenesis protein CcmE n=1 Tax=Insolitispirillum peregrinum TaxID=80876 RepID=A0A1N7JJX6_9PROT|nr:cytochrome c maturation protein CcmE [Insolitispirillum peregrinum]SIS49627.1 cytochrome c-type biogenesis protein CcmE [Insolitispirillum peregrinum]